MTCTATEDDVDVFMSGYVFRLKIWHERGLSLLKRERKNSKKKNLFLFNDVQVQTVHFALFFFFKFLEFRPDSKPVSA